MKEVKCGFESRAQSGGIETEATAQQTQTRSPWLSVQTHGSGGAMATKHPPNSQGSLAVQGLFPHQDAPFKCLRANQNFLIQRQGISFQWGMLPIRATARHFFFLLWSSCSNLQRKVDGLWPILSLHRDSLSSLSFSLSLRLQPLSFSVRMRSLSKAFKMATDIVREGVLGMCP